MRVCKRDLKWKLFRYGGRILTMILGGHVQLPYFVCSSQEGIAHKWTIFDDGSKFYNFLGKISHTERNQWKGAAKLRPCGCRMFGGNGFFFTCCTFQLGVYAQIGPHCRNNYYIIHLKMYKHILALLPNFCLFSIFSFNEVWKLLWPAGFQFQHDIGK